MTDITNLKARKSCQIDNQDVKDVGGGVGEEEEKKKIEPVVQKKNYIKMPQKGKYRMRAHINPLTQVRLPYPIMPDFVDWSIHYPSILNENFLSLTLQQKNKIYTNTGKYPITYLTERRQEQHEKMKNFGRVLDIGCGYGNLLVEMAKALPQTLFLGLQIRDKVTHYVGEKIRSVRNNQQQAWNAAVIRTNAMKTLLNYFRKGQIDAMFFCFPDPHFKKANFRRRIINRTLLNQYAYVLKPGGRLYTITDVKDLYDWQVSHIEVHPSFKRIEFDLKNFKEIEDYKISESGGIFSKLMHQSTDQAQKVDRNKGDKYFACFERINFNQEKEITIEQRENMILDLLQ